jgi:hypothetical protein
VGLALPDRPQEHANAKTWKRTHEHDEHAQDVEYNPTYLDALSLGCQCVGGCRIIAAIQSNGAKKNAVRVEEGSDASS